MSFSRYLSRILAGLPGVDSEEVIRATSYDTSSSSSLAAMVIPESDYDLRERPLDLHTHGAISPQLQAEDCLTSDELHEASVKALREFGVD